MNKLLRLIRGRIETHGFHTFLAGPLQEFGIEGQTAPCGTTRPFLGHLPKGYSLDLDTDFLGDPPDLGLEILRTHYDLPGELESRYRRPHVSVSSRY